MKSQALVFKGVRGELVLNIPTGIRVEQTGAEIRLEGDDNQVLGLFTSLIKNAIQGVSQGFQRELELVGVGYKAVVEGDILKLSLGYSHPVKYKIPTEVKVSVEGGTRIIVEGVDKQKVGQVAAEIRKNRPPEPYKGKGIRYKDEVVRRKHGKVVKATVGGGA